MTSGGRVLIVCTGNVCRSPFVERVLAHQLDVRGIPTEHRVVLSSAGTAALVGEPMDRRCAGQARAEGATTRGFVARQVTSEMVADADLVLTATRGHRAAVARLHPPGVAYTFALRDFAMLAVELELSDLHGQGRPGTAASRMAAQAAARRGLSPPLAAQDADIVDPYGRPDATAQRMARQIMDTLPPILRVFAG